MLNSMSVKLRIIFGAGACLAFVTLGLLYYSIQHMDASISLVRAEGEKSLKAGAVRSLKISAQQQADSISSRFEEAEVFVRSLSVQIMSTRDQAKRRGDSAKELREELNKLVRSQADSFPEFLGIALAFEENALDGMDSGFINAEPHIGNDAGRFAIVLSGNETYTLPESELSNDGAPTKEWFYCPRQVGKSCVIEPYAYQAEGKSLLLSTVATPLFEKGHLIGIVSVDLILGDFQDMADVASDNLYPGAVVSFVSHAGLVAARSGMPQFLSKAYETVEPDHVEILKSSDVEIERQVNGASLLTLSAPFHPIPDSQVWHVVVDAPIKRLMAPALALNSELMRFNSDGVAQQIGVCSLFALIGLAAMWVLAGSISRPISRVADRLREIAQGNGDLTGRLVATKSDELGNLVRWFNSFLDKLQPIIKQATQAATDTDRSAELSSNMSLRASQLMLNQLQEVDQVATAANEMSATSQEVARGAALAANSARDGEQAIESCRKKIQASSDSVQGLLRQIADAVRDVDALAKSSDRIGSVLGVIRSVAEQTNLLALNAAIEAARAGEQGRGFAVVADEVRHLAKRTQDSVVEIQVMIKEIQEGTRDVVLAIEQQNKGVLSSVELAGEAVLALEAVDGSIQAIADMNIQIASAAEEQSAVSDEVSRSVSALRDVAEKMTRDAEESVEVGRLLKILASDQENLMKGFKA